MTVYATYRQCMIKICIYMIILWVYTCMMNIQIHRPVRILHLSRPHGINACRWPASQLCPLSMSWMWRSELSAASWWKQRFWGRKKLICRSCSKRETMGCHGFSIFFLYVYCLQMFTTHSLPYQPETGWWLGVLMFNLITCRMVIPPDYRSSSWEAKPPTRKERGWFDA